MNNKKQAVARLRYLKIAPRKVRLVTNLIKGLSVAEAEAEMQMLPKRASLDILKLVRSARKNAELLGMNTSKLYIKEIKVDQGPNRFRKWLFRARGGAELLTKKMSHVSVILEESDKLKAVQYVIPDKKVKVDKDAVKEQKGEKKEKEPKEPPKPTSVIIKPKQQPGFIKKIFRRKSI